MDFVKMTIYFLALFLLATAPLWIGGILLDKDKKTIAYIFGFLYIPYFIAMGLFGGFQQTTVILKNILGL